MFYSVVRKCCIYIEGIYYSKEQFIRLLDTAQEMDTPQTRSALALTAGTFFIPGVGQVVVTAFGVILVAGTVIGVGTWVYNVVTDWFAQRSAIDGIKSQIPPKLKDANGNVKLGNFNRRVKGGKTVRYKEKGGWIIEKDNANHGGSTWKLKKPNGDRVASLDENGKVLRK